MKTNDIRRDMPHPSGLDQIDRKLLRLLAERADRSYAALSELVNLSAPAVHERVKRLRRDGVIQGVVAKLDGAKIGCPLLAFIHVTAEGRGMAQRLLVLQDLADIEEIHTVTGDTCMILKVRCASSANLEQLLWRLQEIEGIRTTQSYVALGTYLERGPMPNPPAVPPDNDG